MLDLYTQIHTQIFDADRIPYAIAAIFISMVVGMITGPLAGNANPLIWGVLDGVFGGLGTRMDRLHRSKPDLMLRGFLLTAFMMGACLLIAKICENLALNYSYDGFSEVLVLSMLITSGSVWFAVLKLYFALEKKEMGKGAYYIVSRSTRVDLNSVDDFGITRTAMAFLARSFDKGLVAPIFWYLIGGLPLAFVYACVAMLGWRFGKDGFTKGFGEIPLVLERLMGIVPSIFAGILFSFIGYGGAFRKVIALIRPGKAKGMAPYYQGGLPLSALAWHKSVALGGPVKDISGSTLKNDWIGPEGATAKVDHKILRWAIFTNVGAHIVFLAALFCAYLLANKALI
ncbi:MAG: cobalamin biosynthesis protein CobD [Micavibrio sp.]|nr:MAG: cobalamin biosynthesis protein CobD [Micavibrio sp.]